MHDLTHERLPVQVGSKRKRDATSNENARTGGRPTRGSGRLKRLRTTTSVSLEYSSDEDEASSLGIEEAPSPWPSSTNDQGGEDEDEDEDFSSMLPPSSHEKCIMTRPFCSAADDYLINTATAQALQRLRKDDLVRLYALAGLSEDAETLTKSEIVDSLIAARDDLASLPPSSPPGNSSEYSSDDGDVAENEEQDTLSASRYGPAGSGLRRRATVNDMGVSSGRPYKGRSFSLGNLNGTHTAAVTSHPPKKNTTKFPGEPSGGSASRLVEPSSIYYFS